MDITLNFIGGLFEGEGTFAISLVKRECKGRPWLVVSPMARIGMKEYNDVLLNQIKEFLKIGKIYYSNKGKLDGVVSWQTTNETELREFIYQIKDYLFNKKEQAEIMLKALDVYYKKYEKIKSNKMKMRTKEDIMQIIKYSLEMNSLVSVNAKRRQNLKGIDYWEKYVDNIIKYRQENPLSKGGMSPKYSDEDLLLKVKIILKEGYNWKRDRNTKELVKYRFGSWENAVEKAKSLCEMTIT